MITREKVRERRAQIANIPAERERIEQTTIRNQVVAILDDALEAEDIAPAALADLWAMCDAAMESRLGDCKWTVPMRPAPAKPAKEPVAPDPAPAVEVSPRTGKPKRKYTRRKKKA